MAGQSDNNFLELTVKSTSGTYADRWNRNLRAQRVLDDAIKYFGLAPSTYVLRREVNNQALTLGERLDDLGLSDGDVLLLQTSQAQDG